MSPELKAYIKARLREPSTWRSLVYICTGLGIPIAPQMAEAIVAVGLVLAGTIGATTPDRRE
jgi:hypothetical protein